jgi:hypothetical protein
MTASPNPLKGLTLPEFTRVSPIIHLFLLPWITPLILFDRASDVLEASKRSFPVQRAMRRPDRSGQEIKRVMDGRGSRELATSGD